MKLWPLLLLASISIVVATGCGGGDDPERGDSGPRPAARVGNTTISERAVAQNVLSVWPLTPEGVNKPPVFEGCVTAKRAIVGPGQTDDDLRRQCKFEYGVHKGFTLGTLIKATWTRLEAQQQGVEPSAAEWRAMLAKRLQRLDPGVVKRILASDRLREDLSRRTVSDERNQLLTKHLHLSPDELNARLLKRYGSRTSCAPKYKVAPNVDECVGRTRDY